MIKNQPKILYIAAVFVFVIITGIFFAHSSHKKPVVQINAKQNSHEKLWDVASGDTNNEVLRTVIANQQKLKKQNEKLQQENNELREKGIRDLQDKLQKTQSSFENQLAQIQASEQEKHLQTTDNNESYELSGSESVSVQNGVITNVPDLSIVTENNTIGKDENYSLPTNKGTPPVLPSDQPPQKVIPYYTIPAGSTLNQVSLMTSIISEVPVSGHLVAPAFPFKAIVGKKDCLLTKIRG